MLRQCLALILFITPAITMAQRYGRPYSLAENPQVLLEVKAQKQHHYFRAADLRKMPHSSVTLVDPATHTSHVYEGVTLDQLVPSTAHSLQGERVDVAFGSHQTVTLSGTDLDAQSQLLLADTVDGKQLSGHIPYYLVARSPGKLPQTLPDVLCITIHSTKSPD
jgi:hypothetical protein